MTSSTRRLSLARLFVALFLLILAGCGGQRNPDVCTPDAQLLDDPSLSDFQQAAGGAGFEQIWIVENTGDCAWDAGYHIALQEGDAMGETHRYPIPPAEPGEAVAIVLQLTAPAEVSSYFGVWMLEDPEGVLFGPGLTARIIVNVAQAAADTPTETLPTPTATLPPLGPPDCTPDARFVTDVTIPDGTVVAPGEAFSKVWRYENTGDCPWGEGYSAVFTAGDLLGSQTVALPPVAPGEMVDFQIEMVAPGSAGTFTGIWVFEAPDGSRFGTEPYVQIVVKSGLPAPAPSAPALGGVQIGNCNANATFVLDITIPDNTILSAGSAFDKTWRIKNAGTCDWGAGYTLVYTGGDKLGGPDSIPIPATPAGSTVDLTLPLVAPTVPGSYTSLWSFQAPGGTRFGTPPYIQIVVPGAATSTTPYPHISGITFTARQIYLNGQGMGRRPNVFSKVGDSITFAWHYLRPIGDGIYDLHAYSGFQAVLNYYTAAQARTAYTWNTDSYAAIPGWQAGHLLDPTRADPACGGLSPLQCEINANNPAVALIMIGSNDCTGSIPIEIYAANLTQIVEQTIGAGVIPVLSTIPWNSYCDEGQFNSVILTTARSYDIPLIDLYSAMDPLPNHGVSEDGVHPSIPPDNNPANFSDDNLRYGYTMRNFTALQALDAIWRQVLSY